MLFISCYKKLSSYMLWFTAAILSSVTVQVLQTIILPADIYRWAPLICLIFFGSVLFTSHAVYLRLGIQTQWRFSLVTIYFSVCILCYFCYVQPSLEIRLLTVALTSLLLSMNNALALYRSRPQHFLDRTLKYSLYGMIAAILIRAIYLSALYNQLQWLAQKELIWAMTQFLMLFFAVVMITIFISCSINDRLIQLHTERSLDPLTGLLNRRALNERLNAFFKRKSPNPHAVLICDIDHFKKINDRYGHSAGDLALQHCAQIMSKRLRCYHELARIGGEEFQILLMDVSLQEALQLAESIRQNISASSLLFQEQSIHFTVSIGISFFHDADDYNTALREADQLLYQAKKNGRNNTQHILGNTLNHTQSH